MKIFLDSANIEEITAINNLGIIDGITTNPSLIAATNTNFLQVVSDICKIVDGDISVEVVANDFDNMIEQGQKILEIADNIVVKLPMTWDGIKACKYFASQNIKVNMTLCFSANQALLAAKAGAYYISPFIGRLDDIGYNGMELISDIRQMYDQHSHFHTKILAASIRSPRHVHDAAMIGTDVITLPSKILLSLLDHPLTTQGLDIFNKDWTRSGLSI